MFAARRQESQGRHDICIVGLKCWGFMSGSVSPRFIGGIEADLVTLARALADANMNVALITYDEGQGEIETFGRITCYRSFSPDAGLPGLRFIFPRAIHLMRTIRRVDAPYVIQMGAGVETGWTGIAVRLCRPRRRFIFFAGGDRDCLGNLPAIRRLRERIVYRIGLRLADCIVTQTDAQAQLLLDAFGMHSEILRLPNSLRSDSGTDDAGAPGASSVPRILWVGRIDRNKRPDWLLELAAAYPGYRFDVIGESNAPGDYSMTFRAAAERFANVRLHGRIPRQAVVGFYKAADVLCCTSEFEGFPATFLEAWSFGLPTISTVDPGAWIQKYDAGVFVRSLEEMRAAIAADRLAKFRAQWSANALRLFAEEFAPDACLARFQDLLRRVA